MSGGPGIPGPKEAGDNWTWQEFTGSPRPGLAGSSACIDPLKLLDTHVVLSLASDFQGAGSLQA